MLLIISYRSYLRYRIAGAKGTHTSANSHSSLNEAGALVKKSLPFQTCEKKFV